MNKIKLFFAALALLLASSNSSTRAETEQPKHFTDNGNMFEQQCSANTSDPLWSSCFSYVIGVVDGMAFQKTLFQTIYNSGDANTSPPPCFPEGSTKGQAYEIVVKYIHDHPENRHWTTERLIDTAIAQAWACAKSMPDLYPAPPPPPQDMHAKDSCIGSLCYYFKSKQ